MWYLFLFFLSVRQDYVMVVKVCEGVFEQFKDLIVFFGKFILGFKSEYLNDME